MRISNHVLPRGAFGYSRPQISLATFCRAGADRYQFRWHLVATGILRAPFTRPGGDSLGTSTPGPALAHEQWQGSGPVSACYGRFRANSVFIEEE